MARHEKTKLIVVFRHGSNAANQSMRLVAPVFICEATDGAAAKSAAEAAGVNCYNNQHLSWNFASRCKAADCQEAREATEALKQEAAAWVE